MTIALTTADLATAGSYPVVVTNPGTGWRNIDRSQLHGHSRITRHQLSPACLRFSAVAGTASQILTLTGNKISFPPRRSPTTG